MKFTFDNTTGAKETFRVQLGKKGVMYGLYHWIENYNFSERYGYWDKFDYICPLSQDFQEAKEKAQEKLAELPAAQSVMADYGEVIVEAFEGHQNAREEKLYFLRMKSGKHEGQMIPDLIENKDTIGYVLWLLGQANDKRKNIEWKISQDIHRPIHRGFIQEWDFSKREQWLLDNQDAIWAKWREFNPKPERKPSSHLGEVGQKMECWMKVKKVTGYDGYYGWTSIYILEDKDGNDIVYKGNSNAMSVLREAHEQGYEWGKVGFTVKEHGEYNERKQTIISRPKLIEASPSTKLQYKVGDDFRGFKILAVRHEIIKNYFAKDIHAIVTSILTDHNDEGQDYKYKLFTFTKSDTPTVSYYENVEDTNIKLGEVKTDIYKR